MIDCLYIYANLSKSSIKSLIKLAKALDLSCILNKFHCTIIHSDRLIPDFVVKENIDESNTFFATPIKVENWIRDSKCYTVLVLESVVLCNLHEKWKDLGATHNYQRYVPHITLSVNKSRVNVNQKVVKNLVDYIQFNGESF